tara:strand:+ start:62 stop:298 length:237 start_codon:yes stop_codon:yes gene_type:complete
MAEEIKKDQKPNSEAPHLELDGVKHYVADMSDAQKNIYNHLRDLNRKIESSNFNLVQLQVGQEAFIAAFKESLKNENK